MSDSGTPFLKSKEIAWTAELPKDEDILKVNPNKNQQIKYQTFNSLLLYFT